MNLKDKTRIAIKKNVYLSLMTATVCLVFSLFILVGSTWAWFSAEDKLSDNIIKIGNYSVSLSAKRINQNEDGKLLTMTNNKKDANDTSIHEMVINERGDYLVRIIPSDKISGYCNLSITDENDNSLLEKDSLIIKLDNTVGFNIHTNKFLKISISNVNWGSLVEYDELQEDYLFADFKFAYDNGTVEYSELPEGFKEVTYILSNGKQYTEDIIIGTKIIVDKTTFNQKIEGKKVIIDDDNQAIAYIYPCVNENGIGGLYVFDLIKKTDKYYPNIGEDNFEIGNEVKHYEYELINEEDNVDVIYKDIIIEGKMDIDETIYSYGVETSDKVKECAYKMEGFHFVGWKYEDEIIENLNDVLTAINPTNEQDITLIAVWDIDQKVLIVDNQEINVKYRDKLVSIDNLPEKAGHTFKGYYLDNKLIIDSNGNFVKDPFDWSNSNDVIALEARWETIVNKVDEKDVIEKTDDENTKDVLEDSSIEKEEEIVQTPSEEVDTQTNIDEQGVENE